MRKVTLLLPHWLATVTSRWSIVLTWFLRTICGQNGIDNEDGLAWVSYQIRKIASCACAGNAGNVFPRRQFQRKPLVSDPGMHHGTCVTHVPWCMSGSLTCDDGENVPGIPGAFAPAILRIWQEAHGISPSLDLLEVIALRSWFNRNYPLLRCWLDWSMVRFPVWWDGAATSCHAAATHNRAVVGTTTNHCSQ